jgi:hypothetical protein
MPSNDSLLEQAISHYRILKRLGSRGVGVVYKAEDIRLHRFVALKFLPDNRAAGKWRRARESFCPPHRRPKITVVTRSEKSAISADPPRRHQRMGTTAQRRPAPPVTDFTSGQIFDFGWSRDGKQLLLAKGENTSDVLLISNFR